MAVTKTFPEVKDVPAPSTSIEEARKYLSSVNDKIAAAYPIPPQTLPKTASAKDLSKAAVELEKILQVLSKPHILEVVAGPDGQPVGSASTRPRNPVEIQNSVGVLLGDEGHVVVRHKCDVTSPTIETADLLKASKRIWGNGYRSVWGIANRRSANAVGFRAHATESASLYRCKGVATGDRMKVRVNAEHTIKGCQLSPEAFLADRKLRELVCAARGKSNEIDSERDAARAAIPAAIASAVKKIDNAEILVADYTAALASLRPEVGPSGVTGTGVSLARIFRDLGVGDRCAAR